MADNTDYVELDCSYNRLTNLKLGTAYWEKVTCNNKLTELDLSNMGWLVNINCRDNYLTSLDVSGLNLQTIQCDKNVKIIGKKINIKREEGWL